MVIRWCTDGHFAARRCAERPIVVVNGELDRIRSGYYPPFWARTEMQYLKGIVPQFMQVGSRVIPPPPFFRLPSPAPLD